MSLESRLARIESQLEPEPAATPERESWSNYWYRVSYFDRPRCHEFNKEQQRISMQCYADGLLEVNADGKVDLESFSGPIGGWHVWRALSPRNRRWYFFHVCRYLKANRTPEELSDLGARLRSFVQARSEGQHG